MSKEKLTANMAGIKRKIGERYFRRVIAHPQGAIVHHGDCFIYSETHLCTCGLHHDLIILPDNIIEEIYPEFWHERNQ